MVLDSIIHSTNMRKDFKLTPKLKEFLSFDLGEMDKTKYKNKIVDVTYYKELKCDIYYPDEIKDKYPVFLIVFGGGWISGNKEMRFIEDMLKPLKYGYACMVINYSLALDEVFPRDVIDVKEAIHFIHQNKDAYHFDDTDITIWGESAGGHLALEACLVPNDIFHLDLNTSVKNMIIFYPLVDIDTVDKDIELEEDKYKQKDSLIGVLLEDNISSQEVIHIASPIHYLNDSMPALFLQHGLQDRLVPVSQSKEVIEKMKDYPNVRFKYELLENEDHCTDYFFSDENVNKMIEFIRGK